METITTAQLFDPVSVGLLELKNRVVMAPMTRTRAGELGIPEAMHATYYAQRAGAGLLITEGANISPQARGYIGTPGIWNEAQIKGWSAVTEAVHAAGSKIVLQLWHVGRLRTCLPAHVHRCGRDVVGRATGRCLPDGRIL